MSSSAGSCISNSLTKSLNLVQLVPLKFCSCLSFQPPDFLKSNWLIQKINGSFMVHNWLNLKINGSFAAHNWLNLKSNGSFAAHNLLNSKSNK